MKTGWFIALVIFITTILSVELLIPDGSTVPTFGLPIPLANSLWIVLVAIILMIVIAIIPSKSNSAVHKECADRGEGNV
ncbi:unnamed protein product [marine sediment metagenome]|uniref:Uncharacterized protein n=1 Tax=marine sediment metagenome TaxID=412755 RepID=X0WBZ7_9ZZZZ